MGPRCPSEPREVEATSPGELMPSGRSISSCAPRSRIEGLDFDELGTRNRSDDNLGDTLQRFYRRWLGSQIDQQYDDLPSVIAIHRSRRIEHRQPRARRESRPRPHLSFEILWNCESKTGRHSNALERRNRDSLGYGSVQIHACRTVGLIASRRYSRRPKVDDRYAKVWNHDRPSHCHT